MQTYIQSGIKLYGDHYTRKLFRILFKTTSHIIIKIKVAY